jgi:hypothetical protein
MAYRTKLRIQGAVLRPGRPVGHPRAVARVNIGAQARGVEAPRCRRAAMLIWTSNVAAKFGRRQPRPPGDR